MTLIEVIAATVLLGTLLVAALSGFSANRQQLLRARAKMVALEAMDQLMADWFAIDDWEQIPKSGRFVDYPGLVWLRRDFRPTMTGDSWPVYGMRIEIYNEEDPGRSLASLEIVASKPKPTAERLPPGELP